MWRNALVTISVLVLFTAGLAIVVYVGLARDRILPKPTPMPTPFPSPTLTATMTPTLSPVPKAKAIGTVREYAPGALIIVISPQGSQIEQIIMPEGVQVTFADGQRAAPKDIVPNSIIEATGTVDAIGRLIAEAVVISQPKASPTVPQPTRTLPGRASPTPTSRLTGRVWRGEYYSNQTLAGTPVLVRNDEAIDFHWQKGSPAPNVPADRFSVRWQGSWPFEEGGHRFYAFVDDGIRLWVAGVLVIDQWKDQAATLVSGDLYLKKGDHDVRVEYYEAMDEALVRVWWDHQGLYPEWKGEYYGNRQFAGEPVLVRNDAEIKFDWGANAPGPQVPADNFTVRWTRTLNFTEGPYRFSARVDDGVRVWVDDVLIIDEWHEGAATTYVGHIWLEGGPHRVRVEYMELGGLALAQVSWERIERFTAWKGEYFANPDLQGRAAFVRDDVAINYDWQMGSPGLGLPADNFSVRWTRTMALEGGQYRFWAIADDGVRFLVDGNLVINAWHDGPADRHEGIISLAAGAHTLVVEYYERGGQAIIRVGWDMIRTPTLTSTFTRLPSPTHTPAPPSVATMTPTLTPIQTQAATPTWTMAPTLTHTPVSTLVPTATPVPSATPLIPTSTVVPSATPSLAPTSTVAPSATPYPAPSPQATLTRTVALLFNLMGRGRAEIGGLGNRFHLGEAVM